MSGNDRHSISNSTAAFARARRLMPGGVLSPVRSFKGVGGMPIFISKGKGCRVWDVDGNSYIDYVASYGPLIAGHAHERVVEALAKAAERGTSFGAPTELESQLAEMIISAIPSVEMIRFVNSGTEAVMSAVRLARAATGRDKIIKCIGGYHGHSDGLLAEAGSGAMTLGTPSSPGIPASIAGQTILVPYNDAEAAKRVFDQWGKELAAFLIEPVAGNMGVVPPAPGYLQTLRDLCDRHGCLLIFDEVMTGFRVCWGGAQNLYGIRPDLTCLGKVIGGGLPLAAYGGPRELMEKISPAGPVYQAGTLSGNPLATSAGLATLQIMREPGAYSTLEQRSARLAEGLQAAAHESGVAVRVNRVGSMLTPFFVPSRDAPVANYAQATSCNRAAYAAFFHSMLDAGVFLPPSQFETFFVGLKHESADIEQTIAAAGKAMKAEKTAVAGK